MGVNLYGCDCPLQPNRSRNALARVLHKINLRKSLHFYDLAPNIRHKEQRHAGRKNGVVE